MIPVLAALILVLNHTICDFVLQSDRMAKGKSSSNATLLEHIGVYGLSMAVLCAVPPLFPTAASISIFIFSNMLLHFVTDYVTSRLTTKFWLAGKRHAFFVTIGFDQFVHIACLLITYALLA